MDTGDLYRAGNLSEMRGDRRRAEWAYMDSCNLYKSADLLGVS